MNSSVPLLTRSTNYFEWKEKMVGFLIRQDLYWVSDGINREYFESDNDWLNKCDDAFGIMSLILSPSLHYLTKSVEYPKDIWTKLDITFGKHSEDHNSTLERTPSTTIFLDPKFSTSTLSVEVVQDEEVAESSTQSIRIEESLLAVTPSSDAPEVYDISSPHMDDT